MSTIAKHWIDGLQKEGSSTVRTEPDTASFQV